MIIITLPNGSEKTFSEPTTVAQVAESIALSLAKAALAGKINDKLVDTSFLINENVSLKIITDKDPEGLEIIRHSSAHLLAHAVQSLFKDVQVTIGPVIDNGFYYDFAIAKPFTPEDLTLIENKMRELAKKSIPVKRFEMSRDEAIQFFEQKGEHYKVEIIKDIPGDQTLSFYQQDDFVDLCRGPHVPNTSHLGVFKLMSIAGAYWRGNSKNAMLQRVYGTAWTNKKELEDYLFRLSEAEKRDHRRIGKERNLFHFQDEAVGMVFWHPDGWTIYNILQDYIRNKLKQYDYQEVRTPQVVSKVLWEKSGHWEKFHEEMFITESEEKEFAIKPMSCPCHVQIFNHGLRSYRDLPLRMAEFGSCHRNEPSGALHGLMRVRSFVQDDGHIFCTEDQIQSEVAVTIQSLYEIYKDLGFTEVTVKLSTRPEKRLGSDEIWDKAEKALSDALDAKEIVWGINPGEGAFYGPKIEFTLTDSLGRSWQCGTIQVDFSMPERLGAKYVSEDSSKQTPVMIHRAIIGTFERFMGILIEHTAGIFPTWLAPWQVVVMNITDQQADYVKKITDQLKNSGFRVKSDLRNEKVGFKIREHTLDRVPYLIVVGDKEIESGHVSVRKRSGEDLGTMPLVQFISLLNEDVSSFSGA